MNPEPPISDEELARVQAALLEALHADLPPQEIVARLQSDPALLPYAEWVASFEPRMIETAAVLVKKWARRRTDPATSEDRHAEGL